MPSRFNIRGRLGVRLSSATPSPSSSQSRSPRPISPAQSLPQASHTTSGNNNVFAEALRKYLKDLPSEERQCFLDAHQSIEPRGLLQQLGSLDDADKQFVGRKLADSSEKFLHILDQLLRGVTIGIQANPEISSLVVGGARLVIDMALKYTVFHEAVNYDQPPQ